jgi:hypothetical protein
MSLNSLPLNMAREAAHAREESVLRTNFAKLFWQEGGLNKVAQ